MIDYFIPVMIVLLLLFALIKKIPVYDAFTEGAKGAIDLCVRLFPVLIAIFLAVDLFRASGLSAILANALAPGLAVLGIPPELTELLLIRPFSGSGSLALLSDLLTRYGTDTYIGKCASVIMASGETVFYVSAVYFAGIKQKKLRMAIPIALLANLIGAMVGCLLCRFF